MRQERRRSSQEEGVRSPPFKRPLLPIPDRLLSLLRHREEGIPMAIFSLSGHTKGMGHDLLPSPSFQRCLVLYLQCVTLPPRPSVPPVQKRSSIRQKFFFLFFPPAEREREREIVYKSRPQPERESLSPTPPFLFAHNLPLVTLPPSFLPSIREDLAQAPKTKGLERERREGPFFHFLLFSFRPLLLLFPLFQLTEA